MQEGELDVSGASGDQNNNSQRTNKNLTNLTSTQGENEEEEEADDEETELLYNQKDAEVLLCGVYLYNKKKVNYAVFCELTVLNCD